MTTLAVTTPQPRAGMRLSVAQFMDLPDLDDKRKMELDDGVLYIMPRPSPDHQFVQAELIRRFGDYRDRQPEPSIEVYQDIILALRPGQALLSPDLVIILPGPQAAVVTAAMVAGVPDIVVEILSSDRNRDLVRKRRLYAQAGVREYWIWDLSNDSVTQLELRNDGYVERAILSAADVLTTPLLPGLAIRCPAYSGIFRHRRRPPRSPE